MYRLLFSGSFDPPTIGHLALIKRAADLCDELIVGVFTSHDKRAVFSKEERKEMIEVAVCGAGLAEKVRVISFDGLLVNLFKEVEADAVVRGLRSTDDYIYEVQMAEVNRRLCSRVETIFLQTKPELAHISSSIVRELASLGESYEQWVPKESFPLIREAFAKRAKA